MATYTRVKIDQTDGAGYVQLAAQSSGVTNRLVTFVAAAGANGTIRFVKNNLVNLSGPIPVLASEPLVITTPNWSVSHEVALSAPVGEELGIYTDQKFYGYAIMAQE